MKIHIVQKGDTFWEISKAYGVDFEELKELNPQISSPDMLMPGMKIKVPHSTKPVKKEAVKESKPEVKPEMKKEVKKETKKEVVQEAPKQEVKALDKEKPLPNLQEIKKEEHLQIKEIDTKKPINHTSHMPPIQQPKEEMIQLPLIEGGMTSHLPEMPQQQHHQQPSIDQHSVKPCCHPIHYHYYPVMGQMMPQQHIQHGYHQMHQQSKPNHIQQQAHPHHCGCQQAMPFHQHQMRSEIPQQFPLPNYDQLRDQLPEHHGPPIYPSFSEQHLNPFPMPPGYPLHVENTDQETNMHGSNQALQTNETADKQIDD